MLPIEFSAIATTILQRLAFWHERARQRRILGELDEHLLKDIGLTPQEARAQAAQPFWSGEATRQAEPQRPRVMSRSLRNLA